MAAVEVTISGVLYDKVNRTMQNVVLIGEASLTGLEIGGGPMPPGPGKPPGIWGGGNVPMPTPPIHLGPGGDIGGPPVIGGGPIIPPPNPPENGDAVKPPPDDGGWGYWPEYGWGYFPKQGQAGPKK